MYRASLALKSLVLSLALLAMLLPASTLAQREEVELVTPPRNENNRRQIVPVDPQLKPPIKLSEEKSEPAPHQMQPGYIFARALNVVEEMTGRSFALESVQDKSSLSNFIKTHVASSPGISKSLTLPLGRRSVTSGWDAVAMGVYYGINTYGMDGFVAHDFSVHAVSMLPYGDLVNPERPVSARDLEKILTAPFAAIFFKANRLPGVELPEGYDEMPSGFFVTSQVFANGLPIVDSLYSHNQISIAILTHPNFVSFDLEFLRNDEVVAAALPLITVENRFASLLRDDATTDGQMRFVAEQIVALQSIRLLEFLRFELSGAMLHVLANDSKARQSLFAMIDRMVESKRLRGDFIAPLFNWLSALYDEIDEHNIDSRVAFISSVRRFYEKVLIDEPVFDEYREYQINIRKKVIDTLTSRLSIKLLGVAASEIEIELWRLGSVVDPKRAANFLLEVLCSDDERVAGSAFAKNIFDSLDLFAVFDDAVFVDAFVHAIFLAPSRGLNVVPKKLEGVPWSDLVSYYSKTSNLRILGLTANRWLRLAEQANVDKLDAADRLVGRLGIQSLNDEGQQARQHLIDLSQSETFIGFESHKDQQLYEAMFSEQ